MKNFYIILAAVAALSLSSQAQDVKTGTLYVGDYEDATELVEGSYFATSPTNFYLAHTGSQLIYTAQELEEMVNDADKENVKITKLSYRFYNEGAYDEILRNVKVFAQTSDATQFYQIEGNKKFFEFGPTTPVLETVYEAALYETAGDEGEIELDFANNPIELEAGKGLILTIVFDADDDDNCTEGSLVWFYSTGISGQVMTYTNNNISFVDYALEGQFPDANATLGCGTNVELPVTKIDYSYTSANPMAIDELPADASSNNTYYNLSGQKLDGNDLPTGIYIHNGKKFIAK